MKEIFQNLGLILLTIVLAFFILIMSLNIMGYSGGEVGMVPLLLLYSTAISLVPTIIAIGLLTIKRPVQTNVAILIFLVSYILISYFYLNINPFDKDDIEMNRNVDLWIHLSEIIAGVIIMALKKIR